MTAPAPDLDPDLSYLRQCLEEADFIPFPWEGEDRNLRAFGSKSELIRWYCQPPGIDGQPYRDRGFYCRELAMVSRRLKPEKIVEFGTSLGIGTCLLRWLNPSAELITVDINRNTYMPGDNLVPTGILARLQGFGCNFVTGDSRLYISEEVELCFIDADHSYESVIADSMRAFHNLTREDPWAIVWHDHNSRHPGVMRAVREFCSSLGLTLRMRGDSDTVWVESGI